VHAGDEPDWTFRQTMIAVGIDVGKRAHEACFLDQQGREVAKPLRFSSTAAGVGELQERLQSLGEPVTIAVEASGHYWLGIQRRLVAQGYAVQVINPLQTDAFRNTGILADLVRIGRTRPNYVPDDTILQLRELTRFRWVLADQIGEAKRRLLTVLDWVFPEFAGLERAAPLLRSQVHQTALRVMQEVLNGQHHG
jgi:transposase